MARDVVATGEGKARVDALRRRFAALTAAQERIDRERTDRANDLGRLAVALGLAGIAICGVLILALAIGVHRAIVIPLRRLAGAVGRLSAGELSVRVPPGGVAEVGALTEGFNTMAESLELSRDELESQQVELEAQQVELEHALSAVEEQKARVELLQRFGDELASASGLATVGEVALAGLAEAAGADVGTLYLRDEDDGFGLVARRGIAATDVPATLRPGDGLPGRALAEQRPVQVDHAEAQLRVRGLGAPRPAGHELHLPLRLGERTIGVVSLGRTGGERSSPGDLALADDLAERAAVACAEALSVRRIERLARDLEALLASMDEGIYGVDLAGRFTLVNPAALAQTGYRLEELLGRDAHEVLHHTRADGSAAPRSESPVARTVATGAGARIADEVLWRRDGTPFPVEYSCYPLFDGDEIRGAVVTFLDISARKLAERERDTQHAVARVLAETPSLETALPRLLQAVCEGLGWQIGLAWRLAEDGARLECLATHAAAGLEAQAARLSAQPVAVGTGPAGVALDRREPLAVADLRAEPPRPDALADPRLRAAVAVPILGATSVLGVAEFFVDRPIEQDGVLDTLRSIAAQIAQYVERQQTEAATQRMRDEFVATVSHELRTPLTAIDGWLHILLGGEPGPLTDDQRRFLTTVKRNSDRLMRLVGDLLLAGQVEAGKLTLQLGPVDVAELARETADLVAASAAEKELELTVDAPDEVVVHGDRARLGQLLTNLVANAIKFTPDGGRVDLEVAAVDDTCRITVRDTGIGIPPEERGRLFERFYRASSATAHAISGTGLGLAISKAIAESHEGTISLADHDGPGSVFVVELPTMTREEASA